jgi:tetratricopeptide (TPR) repeat protein
LHYPSDLPVRGGSNPRLRPPLDDVPGEAWDPGAGRPDTADDPQAAASLEHPLSLETPTHRDLAMLGYAIEDDAAQISSAPPVLDEPRRGGSNPALRPPDEPRRGGSNPALRPPDDTRRSGAGSQPPDAAPAEASGPPGAGLVIRRIASPRAPVARQVARTDSAHSHQVKALIAQRLTLLDKGADHFQLIGVAQDASPDALRKAYFALARQLHPDRLAALGISDDGKHAQRLFAQINAGFAILSEPARREPYVSILRRGGEAAIRAEQAKAEQLARQIVDAEDAFHRGELALRRDQPQAAVAELERAIQLNPEEADYHALLAWSQFCAAPDKMAVAGATRTALDKAIQRSPRAVAARFYLGRVERMLGRDQDALRHFREVLEQAPNHAEAAGELRVIESRLSGSRKR